MAYIPNNSIYIYTRKNVLKNRRYFNVRTKTTTYAHRPCLRKSKTARRYDLRNIVGRVFSVSKVRLPNESQAGQWRSGVRVINSFWRTVFALIIKNHHLSFKVVSDEYTYPNYAFPALLPKYFETRFYFLSGIERNIRRGYVKVNNRLVRTKGIVVICNTNVIRSKMIT